jgi:hypothetical protein
MLKGVGGAVGVPLPSPKYASGILQVYLSNEG